ncbi:MAG TPA: class II aldolase/adducin family protein [Candidatus Acidoferrales bacterium]|nr:class II aldolase/adducin family protein [Candidatus Acidoferrales bacterium]
MSEIETLEDDLRIASKILEWEIGDIWGHVGVRLPGGSGIAVKLFRMPEEEDRQDWLVHFDYSLKKISGVGGIPREAAIYSEIFKARPDVNAATHCHAPMCTALSMANRQITTVHMQSKQFADGVPIYPKPIYIIDADEGRELAQALGKAVAVVIRGHGIVTVGATIREACFQALYLERTAKMLAVASMLGFEKAEPEFLQLLNGSFKKLMAYQGRPEGRTAYDAEWRYYKNKVLKGEPWSRGWV